MCGITGIIHLDGTAVSEEKIKRFNNSLSHRGPDGWGVSLHRNSTVALGHRRLSILDLSESGKQPMTYADGRFSITYNGEVFNFLELKAELQSFGYAFRSESDTEIILAAYHRWGKLCLNKFNGMWAFAIWDDQRQELFMARDRFGIKPLYFAKKDGVFAFASETNAFNQLDGFNREMNRNNLQSAIEDPYIIASKNSSIYCDIWSLPAGSSLVYNDSGIFTQRWYDMPLFPDLENVSQEEAIEQFNALLLDSVKLRLRSDVDIATALSGGLDSSSIFSIVNQILKSDGHLARTPSQFQSAFVASFPNTNQDETSYASEVIKYLNGSARFVDVAATGNLADEIVRTTKLNDTISGTPIVALSSIYQAIRAEGYTISLDGHGVDEMLFGYRDIISTLYYYSLHMGNKSEAISLANTLISMYDVQDQMRARTRINRDMKFFTNPLNRLKRVWDRSGVFTTNSIALDEYLKREWTPDSTFDKLLIKWHFTEYTLPSLLREFDKASMISGVEIRMPFMDYRIVEFCFSLPLRLKVAEGYTKHILRAVMKDRLPDAVRLRTFKVGLQSPLSDWFKNELREFVTDIIHSKDFSQNSSFELGKYHSVLLENLKNNQWTRSDAVMAWKYMNAYLLIKNN